MVKKINDSEFKSAISKGKVVVDFSASWCGPCKMLAPVLEEVSEEMKDIDFYNVDVDECMDIAREYGIQSVPSILVFEEGNLVKQTVGFQPKEALKSFFN